MSAKRSRSPSPPTIRLFQSSKRVKRVDDFRDFTNDLQDTVRRMLPTGGCRYDEAAILAIDFSVSDIPSVGKLRDELLDLLENTYNWKIAKHTIDCADSCTVALWNLDQAVHNFTLKYGSRGQGRNLLTFYFSGHDFADKENNLNICGSYRHRQGRPPTPEVPWIPWKDVSGVISLPGPASSNHRLVMMDCCAAGLANLDEGDVEVLGASAWESVAAASPQSSFTRAIIDELKSINGNSITTTQLVSALHSKSTVMTGASMPVHKRPTADCEPAIIHRIETTPAPLQQVRNFPRFSHVLIAVKLTKENTVPNTKQWATWLKTNLPPYISEIDITAKWKTGSAVVIMVLPIEIWLDLPPRSGYSFMDFHREWDVQAARQNLENALAPQQPQLQEQRV